MAGPPCHAFFSDISSKRIQLARCSLSPDVTDSARHPGPIIAILAVWIKKLFSVSIATKTSVPLHWWAGTIMHLSQFEWSLKRQSYAVLSTGKWQHKGSDPIWWWWQLRGQSWPCVSLFMWRSRQLSSLWIFIQNKAYYIALRYPQSYFHIFWALHNII